MAHLPGFFFYPGDWLKDLALRSCSRSARGTYIDLLCYLFESEERGVAVLNNKPITPVMLSYALGGDSGVENDIAELLERGVLKRRNGDGAIYSARMVKDEEVRKNRSDAGKKGMSSRWRKPTKGAVIVVKSTDKKQHNKTITAPEEEEEEEEGGVGETKVRIRKRTPRDDIWDTVCRLWFPGDPADNGTLKRIGKLVTGFLEHKAVPSEIERRYEAFSAAMPKAKLLTPEGLLRHWYTVDAPVPSDGAYALNKLHEESGGEHSV